MGFDDAKARARAAKAESDERVARAADLIATAQSQATLLCKEFANLAAAVPALPIYTWDYEWQRSGWRGQRRDSVAVNHLAGEGWACPGSAYLSASRLHGFSCDLPGATDRAKLLTITTAGLPVRTLYANAREIHTWKEAGSGPEGYRGSLQVVSWTKNGSFYGWWCSDGVPRILVEEGFNKVWLPLEELLGAWLVELGL